MHIFSPHLRTNPPSFPPSWHALPSTHHTPTNHKPQTTTGPTWQEHKLLGGRKWLWQKCSLGRHSARSRRQDGQHWPRRSVDRRDARQGVCASPDHSLQRRPVFFKTLPHRHLFNYREDSSLPEGNPPSVSLFRSHVVLLELPVLLARVSSFS